MKLKRTKLAALALTALMAVGATSLVAYASEAGGDVPTAVSTEDAQNTLTSTVWSYNSTDNTATLTYTYTNSEGTSYTKTTSDVTVGEIKAATCTTGASVVLTVETTEVGTIRDTYEYSAALGHDFTVKKTTAIYAATCTTNGWTEYTLKCSRCDETDGDTYSGNTTAATGHTYDESSVYYKAGTNTELDSDGNPQLVDITKTGTYTVWAYCTVEGKDVQLSTETIDPSGIAWIQVVYSSATNIAKIYDSSVNGVVVSGKLYDVTECQSLLSLDDADNINNIEMADCSESGTYTLTLYAKNGTTVLSTQTKTIAAHHRLVSVVEFTSDADMNICTVTYTNGTYKVVDNSCTGSVTYKVVTHCTGANCSLKTTCKSKGYSVPQATTDYLTAIGVTLSHDSLKWYSETSETVAASGAHTIDLTTKTNVEADVKSKVSYVDLYKAYKDNKYVTFANNTSTCESAGTVDVQYICTICGGVAKTVNVEVSAAEHDWTGTATMENLKTATCASTGSFDSVLYCANKSILGCTEEKNRTTVLIPRTKHTNEDSVETNGIGYPDADDSEGAASVEVVLVGDVVIDDYGYYADRKNSTFGNTTDTSNGITGTSKTVPLSKTVNSKSYTYDCPLIGFNQAYGVYAYVVTYCDNCGYEAVLYDIDSDQLTITIDSVTAEKSDGTAGSITLTATYTRTTGTQKTFTTTKTYKYYSSALAYAARTESDPINGLTLDSDGVYRYYVNNAVDYTYSGIVTYQGGKFFVANGVLCSDANGLNLYDGTWYYLSQGQVQTQFTGLAEYDGSYFYIVDGVLSTVVNGLVEVDGSKFLVAEGRLINTYNGLYQDFDGNWYFLALGQLQDFTGVTYYDGAFFKLVNGVLDSSFNGTIEYDGATFNVVAGQLYDQVA